MKKNKFQAVVVEEKPKESYNSEKDLALVSFARYEDLYDEYVLDLRCSFHLIPRHD